MVGLLGNISTYICTRNLNTLNPIALREEKRGGTAGKVCTIGAEAQCSTTYSRYSQVMNLYLPSSIYLSSIYLSIYLSIYHLSLSIYYLCIYHLSISIIYVSMYVSIYHLSLLSMYLSSIYIYHLSIYHLSIYLSSIYLFSYMESHYG